MSPPSTSTSELPEERQRNEISALQAIFADEFDYNESASLLDDDLSGGSRIFSPDFKIFLRPKRNTGQSFNSVNATLHIKFSRDYPDIIPDIAIEDVKGVKEEAVKILQQQLIQLANKHRGQEMCFILADYVQEFLYKHMEQVFGSFYEEMLFREQQQNRAEEHLTKAEDDQHAREYDLLQHELRQMRDTYDGRTHSSNDADGPRKTSNRVRFDAFDKESVGAEHNLLEPSGIAGLSPSCTENDPANNCCYTGSKRSGRKFSRLLTERKSSPDNNANVIVEEDEDVATDASVENCDVLPRINVSGEERGDSAHILLSNVADNAHIIRFSQTKNNRRTTFVRITSATQTNSESRKHVSRREQSSTSSAPQTRTSRHQKKSTEVELAAADETRYYRRESAQVFCLEDYNTFTLKEWSLDIASVSKLILQHNTTAGASSISETSSPSRAFAAGSRHNKLRERESLRQLQQVLLRRLEILANEYRQLHNALADVSSLSVVKYYQFDYAVYAGDSTSAVSSYKSTLSTSAPLQNLRVRLLADNVLTADDNRGRAYTAVSLHQLLARSGSSLSMSFIREVARQCLCALSILHDAHLAFGNLRPDSVQILFPVDDDDDDDAANGDGSSFILRLSCHALERRLEQVFDIVIQERYAAVVNLEQEIDQVLQRQLAQTRGSKKNDVHDLGLLLCWLISASRNAPTTLAGGKPVLGELTLKYFGPATTASDVFPVIPSNLSRDWTDFIDKCLYPDRKHPAETLVVKMLQHALFNPETNEVSSQQLQTSRPDSRPSSAERRGQAQQSPQRKQLQTSENSTWSASLSKQRPVVRFANNKASRANNGDDESDDEDEDDDGDTSESISIVDSLMSSKVESRLQRDFEVLYPLIGKGAYGAVVRVRNKLDNRIYAIKQIILPAASHSRYAALQEKMVREVQLLSRLNHDNVVRYYNSWLDYVEITRSAPKSVAPCNVSGAYKAGAKPFGRMLAGDVMKGKAVQPLLQAPTIHVDVLNSIGIVEDDNVEAEAPPMPSYVSGFGSNNDAGDEEDSKSDDDDESGSEDGKHTVSLSEKRLAVLAVKNGAGRHETEATVREEHGTGIFGGSSFMFVDDDDDDDDDDGGMTGDETAETSSDGSSEDTNFGPLSQNKQSGSTIHGSLSNRTAMNEQRELFSDPEPPTTERVSILYIQMEYCEQSTLRTLISKGDLYLDNERVWRLFREIVDGLAHIHSQGMIHRDLKPENIFISSSNRVKIGDFGLATNVAATQQLEGTSSELGASSADAVVDIGRPSLMHSAESMTGRIGTSFYIAPELVKGRAVYTNKVDIFSLGICFFEMCYRPLPTQMERAKILSGLRCNPIQFPPDWVDRDSKSDGTPSARSSTVATTPQQQQIQLTKWMCAAEPRKRPSAAEILQSELLPPAKLEEARAVDWLRQILHHSHMSMFKKIIFMLFERKSSLAQDVTYDLHEMSATLKRKEGLGTAMSSRYGNMSGVLPLLNAVLDSPSLSPANLQLLPPTPAQHASWTRSISMAPTSSSLLQNQQQQQFAEEQQMRASLALETLKIQYVIFDNVINRIESLFRLFGGMRCDTPLFMPKAKSTANATDPDENMAKQAGSSAGPANHGSKQQQVVEFMNRAGSIVSPAFDARTPFARLVGRTGLTAFKRYAVQFDYRENADGLHPRRHLEAAFDIVLPQSSTISTGIGYTDAVVCAQAELFALLACVLREFRAFARPHYSADSSSRPGSSSVASIPNSLPSSNPRRLLLLSHASVFTALLRECNLPLDKAALVQDVVLETYSVSSTTSDARKLHMQQKLLQVLNPNGAEVALDASNCGHFCRLVELMQNKPIREVLSLVQGEFKRKGLQSWERREAERGVRECIDVVNTANAMCAAFDEEFLPVHFSVCLSDRNVLTTLSSGGIMFQAALLSSSAASMATSSESTRFPMSNSASSATLQQLRGSEGKKYLQKQHFGEMKNPTGKHRRPKRQIIAAGGRYDKLVDRFRVSRYKSTAPVSGSQQEQNLSNGAACFGISFALDTIAQAELDEYDADEQNWLAARQSGATVIVVNTGRAELAHLELSLIRAFRIRGISCDRVTYADAYSGSDSGYGSVSSFGSYGGSSGGFDDELVDMCRASGGGAAVRDAGKVQSNSCIGTVSGLAFVQLRDTTTARVVHRLSGSTQRVADQKVALTDVVRWVVDKCLLPLLTCGGGSNPPTNSGTNDQPTGSSLLNVSNAQNGIAVMPSLYELRLNAAPTGSELAAVVQQHDSGQLLTSTTSSSARVNITFALPGATASGSSSNLASKQQRYSSRDKRLFQTTIMNRLKHVFAMFTPQTLVEVVCVDLKEPLLHVLVGSLYTTPEGRVQMLEGMAGSSGPRSKVAGAAVDALPVSLYEHSHAKHRAYLENIVTTLKGLGENVRRRVIIYSLGGEGGVGPSTGPTLYRFVP